LEFGASRDALPQSPLSGSHSERALRDSLRSHELPGQNPLEVTFGELSSRKESAEAYELRATASEILICADKTEGLRCAMATLVQWLRLHTPDGVCPGLHVRDEPDLRERGVMLDISRDRVPTLATACQLVDLLASLKINRLQLYTEHTFAYTGAEHICGPASPWTPEELRALDQHAASWGIELVPNQQSFGHMHRWLSHDSHRHLAEVPEGVQHPFHPEKQPFSLCPVDPEALTFLGGLYDELLPNFQSSTLNVGLDETFDLGEGRSKDAVSERGVAAVYMDFLKAVHELVSSRDHKMQCWADILLNHPEVVPELPDDCEPILWGYEATHPLLEEASILNQSCSSFQIAPGTSSWQSLGGRTDNCIANLRAAAAAARTHSASGLMITDWGDRGHLQPMPVSYLGFLHGAECAWNGAAAEARTDAELADQLDRYALRSPSSGLGAFTLELGRAADACGVDTANMTALFYPVGFPERSLPDERVPGLSPRSYQRARERLTDLRRPLAEVRVTSSEAELCVNELSWVLDLLDASCDLGEARTSCTTPAMLADIPHRTASSLADRLRALGERHADLWLIRSRPGGLRDSVWRLHGLADMLHPS